MMAAASLTLGITHLVVWFKQRSQHANLTFFALASSVAVFSGFELAIVGAQTPAEHALWLRCQGCGGLQPSGGRSELGIGTPGTQLHATHRAKARGQ